jgi:3-oxoacyl-[acyl-carrier protein] reductase
LAERFAFVTSGARGLGNAVVRTLLEHGWHVALTYHSSEEAAKQLIAEGEKLGKTVLAYSVDLMKQADVETAVQSCLAMFPRIDALIHNFGPFVFERVALADYTDDMWRRMMDGNLTNFFWIYRQLIGSMRANGFGRIVTIGYDGAAEAAGWRYRAPYGAAKVALAALTRSIAREERQNGITANMVCPGDIRGIHKMQMIRELDAPEDWLGRPPVGEDVARMIRFLCADDSGQLNGTVTEVTGGYDILAYDDGKEVVVEEAKFKVGETVFVIPWQQTAEVAEIRKIPNRNLTYHLTDGGRQGTFTAYQLKRTTD